MNDITDELLRIETFNSIVINAEEILSDRKNYSYSKSEIESVIKDFEETEEYEKCGTLLKILKKL